MGITLILQQKELLNVTILSVLGLIAVVSLALFFLFPQKQGYRQYLFLSIGALCCGIVYVSWVSSNLIEQRLPNQWENKNIKVIGKIVEIPQQNDKSLRFLMQVEQALEADSDKPIVWKGRIKLSWYKHFPKQMTAGSRWQLVIRAKRPSGFINEYGFDYEKWMFSQRIVATGYVRKSPNNQQLTTLFSVDQPRQQLAQAIEQALPNSPYLGLVQGLALAQRQHISDAQWETLRETGTSHLLAISGLHIGMVAGLGVGIMWLIGWGYPSLFLRIPARLIAVSAGLVFATLYAILAGFTIPTQRAWLMVVVLLLGLMWRRQIPFSLTLSMALLAVLLLDPLVPLSSGFWLSFAAVSSIAFLSLRRFKHDRYSVIRIQVGLSLIMLPLTAAFFHQVSLVSPIANLIAIPWVTITVVPVILLGVLCYPLSFEIAAMCWWLAEQSLYYLMQLLSWLADIPWAAFTLPEVPWFVLLSAGVGILLLCLPSGVRERWLGFVLLLPLISFASPVPLQNSFRVHVLDVGQGSARVIRTQNHTLIFDTGARLSEQFDMGSLVLLPWLQAHGINSIDKLMVSHADNDHSGGAWSLLETMPIKNLQTSALDHFKDYQPEPCIAGEHWQWDGVNFKILFPLTALPNEKKRNNLSCVLRISNEQYSVLLTGDVEKKAERQLIKEYGEQLKSDVLLVPHHGSRTSSTIAFLNQVKPSIALSSSGYRNRFNHPHPKIKQRYQSLDISFVDTQQSGEVQLYFDNPNKTIRVIKTRNKYRRFWHR